MSFLLPTAGNRDYNNCSRSNVSCVEKRDSDGRMEKLTEGEWRRVRERERETIVCYLRDTNKYEAAGVDLLCYRLLGLTDISQRDRKILGFSFEYTLTQRYNCITRHLIESLQLSMKIQFNLTHFNPSISFIQFTTISVEHIYLTPARLFSQLFFCFK